MANLSEGSAEPLLAQAMVLARQGRWDEALELAERAVQAAPDAPEPLLAKARLLRAAGRDRTAALRSLRRAIGCAQTPLRRVEALREYGLMLEPIGRHREAAAAFEEALALLEGQGAGAEIAAADRARREELADLAARAHERAGDLQRALVRHRQTERWYREVRLDMGSYYAREAELLERLGRYDELCSCYARLVEVDPDRVLFAQPAGRPTPATATRIKEFLHGINQVLAAMPGALVPRVLKAGLFYRLGRYRHAETLLRRALETGPEHFYAWHLLGKVLLKQGKRQRALRALERAAALGPDYLDLARDRAAALEMCGQLEEADAAYRHIETHWPGDAEMLRRAAQVRESLGRLEEAYESYRQLAVKLLPPEPDLLVRLAELAQRLGRPAEAQEHLDELLRLLGPQAHEQRARALVRRAAVQAEAGREAAALADLEAACAVAAELPAGVRRQLLLETASLLLEHLEQPERALAVADALLLDSPDDLEALALRGDALFKARRFEEAVACYTRAADRRLADALMEQGAQLFEQERFDKAIGKWNEAYHKNPQAWEIHYNAAAAYARLGRPAPAARYLEAAAQQNPGAVALMEKDPNFELVREADEMAAVRARWRAQRR